MVYRGYWPILRWDWLSPVFFVQIPCPLWPIGGYLFPFVPVYCCGVSALHRALAPGKLWQISRQQLVVVSQKLRSEPYVLATHACSNPCLHWHVYVYVYMDTYIYIYINIHSVYLLYIYIFLKKYIYEYDFKLSLIYVHNILPPVMKHGQWDHSERKAVSQFPYRREFSPLVLLGQGNYMVPCFYLSHGFCKSTNTSGEHHRVWKKTQCRLDMTWLYVSQIATCTLLWLCPFLSIHCHFPGSFISIPWCNPMFSGTQCCVVCFNL